MELIKPKVFKMAGVWLWTCDHERPCGNEFRDTDYPDPWNAAVAVAVKHYAQFHYTAGGAEAE